MKTLLINPPFDYSNPDLLVCEPLSLAYLAAYIRKYGYEVKILDGVAGKVVKRKDDWHYGLTDKEIVDYIVEYKPAVVGITCPFSLRINSTLHIADLVKKVNRNIVTIVGGIHPTIFPRETAKHKNIDYVVIGEGESTLKLLLDHLRSKNKQKLSKIDGLAYRQRNRVRINPKTKYIENLDLMPMPARDLIPMDFYAKRNTILYGLGSKRSACLITSRSCPRKCSFCSMYLSLGSKWRYRNADNVLNEIRSLLVDYHIQEIFIMDDNLTFDKKRMVEICKKVMKEKLIFKWNTPNGVAANHLDKKLLLMMKNAGCSNICIGVESGNDFVRNKIVKKGLSTHTIATVLNACLQIKLPVTGFFILGIPGENYDTFVDTINMVKKLPFSMIATSFYAPFPGTELYRLCISKKYIQPDYWKTISDFHMPIVETPDFSCRDLKIWERQIYYEFIKGHWTSLVSSILTSSNVYFKWGQIKRFLYQRLLHH